MGIGGQTMGLCGYCGGVTANSSGHSAVECCKALKARVEELEVVAAALYLGHDEGKRQFDMYRAVYLGFCGEDVEGGKE